MSNRKLRRAAEHNARKQSRQDDRLQNQQPDAPAPEIVEPVEAIEDHTTSQAQIDANRANAQHSTGPRTAAGKAISSQNRRYHGLAGTFQVMPWEDIEAFATLQNDLRERYDPIDLVEQAYVDRLAQHIWSRQRCIELEAYCFDLKDNTRCIENEKQFAPLARYQLQNERGMDKCVNMLAKFQAARRKEQIGFESEIRKDAAETRKNEAHEARLRLSNARAQHIEIDSCIRQTIEAPIPGAFRGAIPQMSEEIQEERAAA